MPKFAEVVTQTFPNLTPEAISERLFGESLDSWWQEYHQKLESTDYTAPVQIAFFIASFTAMGRLAKADGRIKEAEINLASSVMDHLELTPEQKRIAVRLFNEGKQSDFDFEAVLSRFYRLCRHRVSVMQIFVEIQLQTAVADGPLNDIEEAMLLRMCKRIDVSKSIYNRIKRRVNERKFGENSMNHNAAIRPMSLADAGEILGISRWTNKDEVKKAYRRMLSQFHPDKMVARGCTPQEVEQATLRMQEIKRAYEIMTKARKLW